MEPSKSEQLSFLSKLSKEADCDSDVQKLYAAILVLVERLGRLPAQSELESMLSNNSIISKGTLSPEDIERNNLQLQAMYKILLDIRDKMAIKEGLEQSFASISVNDKMTSVTKQLSFVSKLSLASQDLSVSLDHFFDAVRTLEERLRGNKDFLDAISQSLTVSISGKFKSESNAMTGFTIGTINKEQSKLNIEHFYEDIQNLEERLRGYPVDKSEVLSRSSIARSERSIATGFSVDTFNTMKRQSLDYTLNDIYKVINDLRIKLLKNQFQEISLLSKSSQNPFGENDKLQESFQSEEYKIIKKDTEKKESNFKKSKTHKLLLDMDKINSTNSQEDRKIVPLSTKTLSNKRALSYKNQLSKRSLPDNSDNDINSNISSQEASLSMSLIPTPKHFFNPKQPMQGYFQIKEDITLEDEITPIKPKYLEPEHSDSKVSLRSNPLTIEELENEETRQLFLYNKSSTRRVDLRELLAAIPKNNFHDSEFKPCFHSLVKDMFDDEDRGKGQYEWRRLKYIYKRDRMAIIGKQKAITLHSNSSKNWKLMGIINGLFYKKFDIGEIVNLEYCRHEQGRYQMSLHTPDSPEPANIIVDDFVPVKLKGVNANQSKSGRNSLFDGEPAFELAYLNPIYNAEKKFMLFPCLIEKAMAKLFGSYQSMFDQTTESLIYSLTRAHSYRIQASKLSELSDIVLDGQNCFLCSADRKIICTLDELKGDKAKFFAPVQIQDYNHHLLDSVKLIYEMPISELSKIFSYAIISFSEADTEYRELILTSQPRVVAEIDVQMGKNSLSFGLADLISGEGTGAFLLIAKDDGSAISYQFGKFGELPLITTILDEGRYKIYADVGLNKSPIVIQVFGSGITQMTYSQDKADQEVLSLIRKNSEESGDNLRTWSFGKGIFYLIQGPNKFIVDGIPETDIEWTIGVSNDSNEHWEIKQSEGAMICWDNNNSIINFKTIID